MLWPDKPIVLLDGATGTELGRRGADISLPLWSARAIIEHPELIAQIHRDYLEAGADAITANTFRTHRRSLDKAGLGERAAELSAQAVAIARRVRDQARPDALVLGSVAPLEDCYQPLLVPDPATCAREHAQQISNLLEAGVDGILIETMNNIRESAAAAHAAEQLASGKWMISFCTKSDGPPGMLLSGEPLTDLIPELGGAQAIGVNCVAGPAVEAQVKLLRLLTPHSQRLSAYANVSKANPAGGWDRTDAVDPEIYAEYASRWIAAGASIVGGCCGTRPEMIQAISRKLHASTTRA